MVGRILRALFVAGLLLVLLTVGVWIRLQPPVLGVPSQDRLVLANVTVVNPGLERGAGRTLTVDGDRIESIITHDPTRHASEAPGRFAGSYVLPGLIDMHVHHGLCVGDRELLGLLFLAHGVTTVRNTGDFYGTVPEERRQVREGKYPGPRIFACGPVLDGDPPMWPALLPGSWVVRNAAEAQAAVDELAEVGVHCVKVYSWLSAEVLAAIRRRAAQHGLPVIGHVPLAVPFEEAHLQDVQHLTGVPATGAPPIAHGTMAIPQAYASVWATAWQNLDAAQVDFIARTSLEQGITHTPTLVAFEQASRLHDFPQLLGDPAIQLLPHVYRDVLWRQDDVLKPFAALGEAFPKMMNVVRRLHEAGVRIHAGTDTPNPFVVPGASLHEELHNLVDAGFIPEEAWVAATRWAGESLGEPKLGTLQEGAPADFLIFREDPSHDLAALSTLEAVVAQGRLYPKEVLGRAIQRHRDYTESWLYDHISMTIARIVSWGLQMSTIESMEASSVTHTHPGSGTTSSTSRE
jgi:cytosine/adenosine deaminase-related metal-dependent hydrolase